MKPWELLGATSAADGTDIRLMRRDGEYLILANGRPLMSSRSHGSEEALATLGCREARRLTRPRVLVGGLGMGFTLRAVLGVLPSAAAVTVAELVPAVIQWNREPLAALAGHPLRDPRVRVEVGDVGFTLRANCGRFDAILLDVDNGPSAFTVGANAALYDDSGVAAAYAALCPGGTFAVWSAWEDTTFEQRLRVHGFTVEALRVRARLKKGERGTRFSWRTKTRASPRSPDHVCGSTGDACRRVAAAKFTFTVRRRRVVLLLLHARARDQHEPRSSSAGGELPSKLVQVPGIHPVDVPGRGRTR